MTKCGTLSYGAYFTALITTGCAIPLTWYSLASIFDESKVTSRNAWLLVTLVPLTPTVVLGTMSLGKLGCEKDDE